MKKEINQFIKIQKFLTSFSFKMSTEQYRLSLGSNNSLGPFNNYDGKEKSSWSCFLCNGSTVVDEDSPSGIYKKSKINLSKISKTIKSSNLKSIIHRNVVQEQKLHRKDSHRLSLKSPQELQVPKSMHQSNLDKPSIKMQSCKNIRFNQPMVNSTIDRSTINSSQCNVYTSNKFSQIMGHHSNVAYASHSQKLIQPVQNTQDFKPQHIRSSQCIKTADSSSNQRSLTNVFIDPKIQSNIQQNFISPQIQWQNHAPQFVSQNQKLHRKPSIKNSSKFNQNLDKTSQSRQNILFTQNPMIFSDIKLTESIEKAKSPKLKSKKSSGSGKSKGSKFLVNMRKVTSRSQAPQSPKLNQSASLSLFGQIGNKIKIGIRKVQSFNSQEQDQDQYSEVLSHGQKSFLMTEINEVSERSRISSASRFKFWEQN